MVSERVRQLVADHFATSNPPLPDQDLDLDSLDRVELAVTLEEQFQIEVTDDEAERFVTVQDMVDLITQKTQ